MSDYKKIISVAWPLIISNSLWNMQLTIDRIFLGMYSTESLGAAMAVMGVFWVPMALLQQTAAYVTTFVAQYYGAKEYRHIGSAIWNGLYVSIVGGLLFMLLLFVSEPFFAFTGHSEQLAALEVRYFDSITYSALPAAIMAVVSGFYTGIGKTRVVIWINLVAMLGNAVLDYLLIFGNFGFPMLGIDGAGYATSIGNYAGALFGFYLLFNEENERLYAVKSDFKLNFQKLKSFLRYGLPSGFQWALEGLAFTTFLMILGTLKGGEVTLSSSSIGMTIMMLSILPTMGIAQSVMTLVGQRMGEEKPDSAESIVWKGIHLSFVYMLCIALTFVLIPDFYLSWFKNEQNPIFWQQVSELTRSILMIIALFTIFDSMYLNLSFALKGAGDTKFVSMIALIVPWPFMVFPTYMLKEYENAALYGWWFVALYSIVSSICLYLRFKSGAWKLIKMI